MEENSLLPAFGLQRGKVFLMGSTKIGQHGYGGLDNITQGQHLVRLADTGLENAQPRVLIHQPDRERHSNLRIIATRTACHLHIRRQQLVQPLLDHRLPVRSGDSHNGYDQLISMTLGQSLQSLSGIEHFQEIGICVIGGITGGHCGDHEIFDSTTIKVGYIIVSIVALRFQRKKQSFLGEAKRTTIGKQEADVGIMFAITTRTYQGGYFLNSICHYFYFYSACKDNKKYKSEKAIAIKRSDFCLPRLLFVALEKNTALRQ